MNILSIQQRVKFAEPVWHDQAYKHPQLKERREKDFYGRQGGIQKATTVLQFSSKPIIFIGERRAGKTSILKLLMHSLENKPEFINIEMSWLGIQSAPDLMREILYGIYVKLELSDLSLRDTFEKVRTPTEFRNIVQTMLKGIPDKMLAIGIDEFDTILMEQPDSSEKKKIIDVIISLVETEGLPVKIILTMTREPGKLELGFASPLTTKSEKIRLEPFSKSEMEEMLLGILENQIPISEQEQKEIFELSGGWPYFAKALLYYWLENLNAENRLELAKEQSIQDLGLSDALGHIYLKHWDESEKTIILLMAKQGGSITAEIKSMLELPVKAAAQELIKRGYLLAKDDGYTFRVVLFQDWFSRWIRFEEQAQQYAAKILVAIERKKDPWADVKSADIFNGAADEEE